MHISREDFLKQEAERSARAAAALDAANQVRVGYFGLKSDGDEAVVRFCYNSPDEFDIVTTHQTTLEGKFRRVNCLRSFTDPINKCPMCASGNKMQQRFYIKLIEYTRDDNGNVVATPKIWERPTTYVTIFNNLFSEYGNISDCIFKVKRSGEANSLQTTYNIMYCNPNIYNDSIYMRVDNAFEGYSVIGSAVLDRSYEELEAMLGPSAVPANNAVESVVRDTAPVQVTPPRKVTY